LNAQKQRKAVGLPLISKYELVGINKRRLSEIKPVTENWVGFLDGVPIFVGLMKKSSIIYRRVIL